MKDKDQKGKVCQFCGKPVDDPCKSTVRSARCPLSFDIIVGI